MHMCARTHTHTHVHTHTRTHTHTHAYTLSLSHSHTHTHTGLDRENTVGCRRVQKVQILKSELATQFTI